MQKEIKVFVASKQEEFESERKEIGKLISDLKDRSEWNISSIILETKGPDKGGIEKHSLKKVEESDIFILLLGRDHSEIAEKEYYEACRLDKERLIYIKELKERDKKISNLIERIHDPIRGDKTDPFTDENDLLKKVHLDLSRIYPKLTSGEITENNIEILNQYKRNLSYRSIEFIFLPTEHLKKRIDIDHKYEAYLWSFHPHSCEFVYPTPTPEGLEFGDPEKGEQYARIDNNLLIYYSAPLTWTGNENVIHVKYTAKIICGLIEYPKRIYRENNVDSAVKMLFNLYNVRNTFLKFEIPHSRSRRSSHSISYIFKLEDDTKDIAVGIINKFYRCFGLSVTTTKNIEKMVEEILKKRQLLKITLS